MNPTQLPSRPLGDNIACDLCKQLVRHLKDILIANTTEIEFKQVLMGLCGQMREYKEEVMLTEIFCILEICVCLLFCLFSYCSSSLFFQHVASNISLCFVICLMIILSLSCLMILYVIHHFFLIFYQSEFKFSSAFIT